VPQHTQLMIRDTLDTLKTIAKATDLRLITGRWLKIRPPTRQAHMIAAHMEIMVNSKVPRPSRLTKCSIQLISDSYSQGYNGQSGYY
jgi:hypothetical protein